MNTKNVLASLWFAACVAVLGFAISLREYPDMEIPYIYFMFFLSAPAGFAVGYLYALASNFVSLPVGLLSVLCSWPLYVMLGYVQWFLFAPWLYRRAKSWLHQKRT